MGKGAYIRIQNKSTFTVTVSVEDRHEVGNVGMDLIQGSIDAGGRLPYRGEKKFADHRHQYIEGNKRFFIQEDGFLNLVVNVEGSSPASTKLEVNASEWWCERVLTTEEDSTIMIATDVEEEDDQFRIEIRIYNVIHTKSWMGQLADCIEGKLLCRVGLPGTHDSSTYDFDEDMGASPDSDLTMTIQDKLEGDGEGEGIFSKIGSAINDQILGRVWESLCKCQHKSIKDQLEAGVRYLDLRIVRHEETGKFYTCHGVFCVDMKTVIDEINTFLTENSKEIVLLDINHLFQMDGHHNELVDDMLATLGDKVANFNSLKPTSTVGDYWNAGAQAVILYCGKDTLGQYDGRLWSQREIKSPWPQAAEITILHDKLKINVEKRSKDTFFVLQGLLTPDGNLIKEEIMESNISTSLETIACRVNCKVVAWIEDEWNEETHNVVIVDFFESCSMVPAIINWNRK